MTTVITTAPRIPARIPAAAAGPEYRWERAVIAHWCGVEVLDIDVENTVRAIRPDTVTVIEIIFTVGTTPDAQTLAVVLDLPAVPSDPAVAWRTWTGLVSALSSQRPVLVTVTAPTTNREAR